MVQLLKITGLIALLAQLPAESPSAAGLSGIYRGEIGQLNLQTRGDGRVVGRFMSGGKCGFDPQRPVLDGEFEGKVLVANLTLCQTGPGSACEEHPFTILAFLDPSTGNLVGDVKLDAGCDSPALKSSRFVLEPVPPEEIQPAAHPVATRKGKRQDAILEALDMGKRLLHRADYAGASFYFEQSLAYDDKIWSAHLSMGLSEFNRGNLPVAKASFERARDLIRDAKQSVRDTYEKDIYYDLARVSARQNDRLGALRNLRHAVELGFSDPAHLDKDRDLEPLHNEREFQELRKQVLEQHELKQPEATKKGEP